MDVYFSLTRSYLHVLHTYISISGYYYFIDFFINPHTMGENTAILIYERGKTYKYNTIQNINKTLVKSLAKIYSLCDGLI